MVYIIIIGYFMYYDFTPCQSLNECLNVLHKKYKFSFDLVFSTVEKSSIQLKYTSETINVSVSECAVDQ